MCRIFGCWGRDEAALEAMQKPLIPGGPDNVGYYVADRISLGHRRLSIIDLSSAANQPLRYENLVMSYNGEVYNFEAVKRELGEYSFKTHSDTEVIIKAFHKWGVDEALKKFRGMFAIALWDGKKLTLIRDRLGVKPLYYYYDGKNFIFASELKGIVAHPKFKKEVDKKAAALFFQLGYIPTPYSIYKNVYKLEPGTILEFDGKQIAKRRFWSLQEAVQQPKMSEEEAKEAIEPLLQEAFELRMVADVDVGVFLSGGVDSSLVAALLSKRYPLQTFTIGFDDPKFNEAPIAKEVAKILGTAHHERYFGAPDLLQMVPQLVEVYDEPFGDSSALPTLMLSAFTKEYVKVALSADGADELFWGYPANFKWAKRYESIQKLRMLAPLLKRMPLRTLKKRGYLASEDLLAFKLALRYRYFPDETQEAYSLEELLNKDVIEALFEFDLRYFLIDDVLVKVDRASMANSLEAREPFLDHKLVEFALRVPNGLKFHKKILKEVLAKYLPKELIDRPKQGFSVPIKRWLFHELKSEVERVMKKESLFEEIVKIRFFSPKRYNTLWYAYIFKLWEERWLSF